MNVIPFRPEHVGSMRVQERQLAVISHCPLQYLEKLAAAGPSVTAELDGRIIACAGVAVRWSGYGTLWAFVAQDSGPHFVRLDRCVRRLIESANLRRIDATTEVDFSEGRRWLELLGFEVEGDVMRKYGPDGEDHISYVRFAETQET